MHTLIQSPLDRYHVVATYNGTRAALYLDGILQASTVVSAQPTRIIYPEAGATSLVIGAYFGSQMTKVYAFTGSMDNIAVWGEVPNAVGVMMMYTAHRENEYFVCPAVCPNGQVQTKACTGDFSTDCDTAVRCPQCQPGQRLSAECSGIGSVEPVTCVQCSTCASGEYVSRACSQTGEWDTECSACSSCPRGQYTSGECRSTGTSDVVCADCRTCVTGQYTEGFCDGSTRFNVVKCHDCRKSCGPGRAIEGSCSGIQVLQTIIFQSINFAHPRLLDA